MPQPKLTAWAAPIATLAGIGRAPYAPGTVASLVSLPFAFGIARGAGPFVLVLAAVFAGAVGAWACELYAQRTGKTDPSECVIDELAGQWLACAFAPLTIWGYLAAFILFRAFDITKLWPVSAAEKLPGGLGIVLDDLAAGVMAGIVIAIARHFGIL